MVKVTNHMKNKKKVAMVVAKVKISSKNIFSIIIIMGIKNYICLFLKKQSK